jgi:NADH/NAD ratio-sensing transcriptional regulator Rex
LQKVNNVVLWGVGVNGYTFLQKSLDYNLNIKNVIDCNESKVGVNVLGYVINDKSSLENSDFVVATNPFHIQMIQGEALHQIKKIEILDARAYLCFDIGFEQAVVNYQQNV